MCVFSLCHLSILLDLILDFLDVQFIQAWLDLGAWMDSRSQCVSFEELPPLTTRILSDRQLDCEMGCITDVAWVGSDRFTIPYEIPYNKPTFLTYKI